MVDERVIATKLEQIEQYHGELREKQRTLSRTEYLEDTTERRAVERMFENAIQACSDLAQHVATHAFDYDGETAKGAVRELDEQGVIDGSAADILVAAIGFRNVLAHEYGQVNDEEVYETLRIGLGVYEEFSQQIARWTRDRS